MSAENALGSTLIATSTPEPRIARAIDLAHAAGAEHSLYFIRAESSTRWSMPWGSNYIRAWVCPVIFDTVTVATSTAAPQFY